MASENANGSTKRILLFGNGVNLVAKSHAALSQENVKAVFVKWENGERKLTEDFISKCQDLRLTFAHHALLALEKHFSAFYTTNYDFAMERAFCGRSSHPKVMHIHGDSTEADQCIYFPSQYKEAVEHLEISGSSELQTWHKEFLSKEVHVVGMTFGSDEKILYTLLQKRWHELQELESFEWTGKQSRIYVWLMRDEENPGDFDYRAAMLRSLSVTVIPVPVYMGDYKTAWECLIGKLLMHLHGIHHQYCGESDVLKLSRDDKHITTGLNVSYSSEPDLKYPDWCLMWVGKTTFEHQNNRTYWLFYCNLPGQTTLWRVDRAFIAPHVLHGDSCFYLDYRNGTLYAMQDSTSAPVQIAQCIYVPDIRMFDYYILHPFISDI